MKHLYLIIISVLLINSGRTEIENFSIEDGVLIWQKVYQTKLSQEEILNEIKPSGKFDEINNFGSKISANISRRKIDFKEMVESISSVPI